MTLTPSLRTVGRLAIALLVAVGLLAAMGAGPAAADFESPRVVPTNPPDGTLRPASTPGCVFVNWTHSGSGVVHFSAARVSPDRLWPNIPAGQRQLEDCGLQPNTTYHYVVCAWFGNDDGDVECSADPENSEEWASGRTSPPETPRQSQRPLTPRIVEHHAGETWIGIKWEAGYDYDSYFVNITGDFGTAKGPRELRTIHHDDDGTWGYQRVDGLLPGRAYTFGVQGCTETFFGIGSDNCWDWSAAYDARTLAYALHSGSDTCAPPFVWREAFEGDHVCVEAARRTQVAADNAQAAARRAYSCVPPNCLFTAPDDCKVPYVWREARPSDHVCVTVEERARVAAENALAGQRRAVAPGSAGSVSSALTPAVVAPNAAIDPNTPISLNTPAKVCAIAACVNPSPAVVPNLAIDPNAPIRRNNTAAVRCAFGPC